MSKMLEVITSQKYEKYELALKRRTCLERLMADVQERFAELSTRGGH
jgi:hypothetical protein